MNDTRDRERNLPPYARVAKWIWARVLKWGDALVIGIVGYYVSAWAGPVAKAMFNYSDVDSFLRANGEVIGIVALAAVFPWLLVIKWIELWKMFVPLYFGCGVIAIFLAVLMRRSILFPSNLDTEFTLKACGLIVIFLGSAGWLVMGLWDGLKMAPPSSGTRPPKT